MNTIWSNPEHTANFRGRSGDLIEAHLTSGELPAIDEKDTATVISLNGLPVKCQVLYRELHAYDDEVLLLLKIPGWQGLSGEDNAVALEHTLCERGEHPDPDAFLCGSN